MSKHWAVHKKLKLLPKTPKIAFSVIFYMEKVVKHMFYQCRYFLMVNILVFQLHLYTNQYLYQIVAYLKGPKYILFVTWNLKSHCFFLRPLSTKSMWQYFFVKKFEKYFQLYLGLKFPAKSFCKADKFWAIFFGHIHPLYQNF